MKNLSLFLPLTLLFIITTNAQKVSGLVVDTKSEPIAYATIQVANYGTITNAEGEFELRVGNLPDDTIASISFIGYKTLELTLGKLKADDRFVLQKDIMSLDEVFLTNKRYTPEELIEKVLERADSNYIKGDYKRTVYARNQLTSIPLDMELEIKKSSLLSRSERKEINKRMEQLQESSKNTKSTSFNEILSTYYKAKDSAAVATVIKATELKNEEKDVSQDKTLKKLVDMVTKFMDTTHTYKISSGIIPIAKDANLNESISIGDDEEAEDSVNAADDIDYALSSVNLKSFSLDFMRETKRYDYVLEDATSYNGKTVYVLAFEPDSRKADYVGKLYINADDFAVVKMDFKIAPNRDGEKLNLKFLLGIKFVEEDASYSITYERAPDSEKYIPQLLQISRIQYAYLNRGFKFKRNKNKPSDEKLKLKFDILVETRIKTESEYYFIDYAPFDASGLADIDREAKFEFERINRYDPSIWETYNVLPAIKELEEYQAD